MTQQKVQLRIDAAGKGKVIVDDHDISYAVTGVQLKAHVSDGTDLSLSLAVRTVDFDGDVRIELPAATREALVALGWTPPPDE